MVGKDASCPGIAERIELKLGFWSVVLTLAYPMIAIASLSHNSVLF